MLATAERRPYLIGEVADDDRDVAYAELVAHNLDVTDDHRLSGDLKEHFREEARGGVGPPPSPAAGIKPLNVIGNRHPDAPDFTSL